MTDAAKVARLADYELLAELATGGMATVYVARQSGMPRVERLVVVKRVHPHLLKLPKFREMFHDEARLASLVQHPNVVRLLDVLDRSGELLLVLEYVESVSLSALLRAARAKGERLSPPVAARIVVDALDGLHAAHEAKDVHGTPLEIVHRDVSPQNILVDMNGRSHIIDFGIAKASSRLTETTGGTVKGKLSYMSPEQAKGISVDRRSDVFSAGIVMYEALTGRRLFEKDDADSDGSHVLLKILLDPIAPPSTIAPDVPTTVDVVAEHALERVRDERYATALELRDALLAALPPASHEDVARTVARLVGETVTKRRESLRRILDGSEPARVELGPTSELPTLEDPEASGATATEHAFADVARKPSSRRNGVVVALAIVGTVFAASFVATRKHDQAPAAPIASTSAAAPLLAPSDVLATAASDAPVTSAPATSAAASIAITAAGSTPRAHHASQHASSHASANASANAAPASTSTGVAPAASTTASSDLHNDNPY